MPLQNRRPRVKTQGYTKDVPKPGLKGRFGHASKHNGAPAGMDHYCLLLLESITYPLNKPTPTAP